MADKQLAVILHHILRVKCDLNRNRKSHHRLSKKTDRYLGEMGKKEGRRNVTQFSLNNFKERPFFSFACSTPAGLVFLLFIFLLPLFHFIHQILHCVSFKISIFHLDLTYIQKASRGNLFLNINSILQNTKEKIHKNIFMDSALECSSESNVL